MKGMALYKREEYLEIWILNKVDIIKLNTFIKFGIYRIIKIINYIIFENCVDFVNIRCYNLCTRRR